MVGFWEVGVIVVGARSVVIGGGWPVERGRGGMGGSGQDEHEKSKKSAARAE